jgi:hypothetical protein
MRIIRINNDRTYWSDLQVDHYRTELETENNKKNDNLFIVLAIIAVPLAMAMLIFISILVINSNEVNPNKQSNIHSSESCDNEGEIRNSQNGVWECEKDSPNSYTRKHWIKIR